MMQLEKVERCREILRYEQFKNIVREMHVEYWFGDPGSGKTSGVYKLYGGYDKVYRVTDNRNPWDGYKGQDVILFDNFRACDFDINILLKWLDIYPLELPCIINKPASRTYILQVTFLLTSFSEQCSQKMPVPGMLFADASM